MTRIVKSEMYLPFRCEENHKMPPGDAVILAIPIVSPPRDWMGRGAVGGIA